MLKLSRSAGIASAFCISANALLTSLVLAVWLHFDSFPAILISSYTSALSGIAAWVGCVSGVGIGVLLSAIILYNRLPPAMAARVGMLPGLLFLLFGFDDPYMPGAALVLMVGGAIIGAGTARVYKGATTMADSPPTIPPPPSGAVSNRRISVALLFGLGAWALLNAINFGLSSWFDTRSTDFSGPNHNWAVVAALVGFAYGLVPGTILSVIIALLRMRRRNALLLGAMLGSLMISKIAMITQDTYTTIALLPLLPGSAFIGWYIARICGYSEAAPAALPCQFVAGTNTTEQRKRIAVAILVGIGAGALCGGLWRSLSVLFDPRDIRPLRIVAALGYGLRNGAVFGGMLSLLMLGMRRQGRAALLLGALFGSLVVNGVALQFNNAYDIITALPLVVCCALIGAGVAWLVRHPEAANS